MDTTQHSLLHALIVSLPSLLPHDHVQIDRDVADTSGTNLQAGIDAAISAMKACRACMEANKTTTENRIILITDAQVGGCRGWGSRRQTIGLFCETAPYMLRLLAPTLAACPPRPACSPTPATSRMKACLPA